ncbi:MAG TPA: hypothetical protein VHW23_11880 [Kofleriaceae bacterium]|nr:hypothetical protein [Kofleriaceae bacterium]
MRNVLIRRISPALVFTASLGAAAAPPPAAPPPGAPGHGIDVYIAGQTLDNQLAIMHVTPDGQITEVFRGGKPSAWHWLDAHTLVELFQDDKDETDLAMIVDGQPAPQRAIRVETASWPPEAKDWPQRLALLNGGVWLIREPAPAPAARAKGKPVAAKPVAGKPVFRRVDVTPNVVQREPPVRELATAGDQKRAWLDKLPSARPPKGLSVTRAKARVGRQMLGTVRCKPARGAMTTFPTAAAPAALRISVDAVKFVSPTLPLYVVSGMAGAPPDGPRFETAAFQGCTAAALHSFAWGGGDVFATIVGPPGGAAFAKDDKRTLQLWVDGRAIANLPLLGSPMLSSAAVAHVP